MGKASRQEKQRQKKQEALSGLPHISVERPVHTIEPIELEVEEIDGRYRLTAGGEVLFTSIGRHEVVHDAPNLIEQIISEFMEFPQIQLDDGAIVEPEFLNSYKLMGLQKEFIELRRDNITMDFALEVSGDPVLRRIAGPEHRDQMARYVPVVQWLNNAGLRIVDVDFVELDRVPGIPADIYDHSLDQNMGDEDRGAFLDLIAFLKASFESLDDEQRAGVVFLHNRHHGSIVHGLALVLGRCSAAEYAAGVSAAHGILAVFADVADDDHSGAHRELRDDANAVLNYVSNYRAGTLSGRLRTLLAEGAESTEIEFKSTLRYNLREGRKDRTMTDVVVKTIAGFLNTRGGTLLIGVDDEGEVVGLDADAFDNDDKFLLHLYTSVTNGLGAFAGTIVDASVMPTPEGRVCVVNCDASPEPVLHSKKGNDPIFYVRTGPKTDPVEGREREEYQRSRWGA